MILRSFFMFFLTLIVGCSSGYQVRIAKQPQTPLFISMPINDSSEQPLAPSLYNALVSHYQKRGYRLVDQKSQGYVLKTTIQGLTPTQHFISQDVVLLHKLVELKVTCSLYNFANTVVAEKTFIFETIISKAQAPLQQDAYTMYSLRGMLEHQLQMVEQFFRQYLQ
jgi:hypothetical protein